MKLLPLHHSFTAYSQLVDLYHSAFTSAEKLPVSLLKWLASRRGVEVLAVYDLPAAVGESRHLMQSPVVAGAHESLDTAKAEVRVDGSDDEVLGEVRLSGSSHGDSYDRQECPLGLSWFRRIKYWLALHKPGRGRPAHPLADCPAAKFVGFVYLMRYRGQVFVFYLAIEASLRGQGYGSELLGELAKRYPGENLVLEISTLKEKIASEDYPVATGAELVKRQRRKEFYLRAGFVDTGFSISENGVPYDILATEPAGKPFDIDGFMGLLSHFLVGKLDLKVIDKP